MFNGLATPTGIFGNAITDANTAATTKRYTSGIDAQGMAYLYDSASRKMVYYGAPSAAWEAKGAELRSQGYERVWEGDKSGNATTASTEATASNTGGGGAGGYVAPPKVLDTAQLNSIDSLIGSYDTIRDQARAKAALKRDTSKAEKAEEKAREESKYQGKKITTLQDFAGAKTDTDLNTRDTLENLVSSLSTMGLGGSRQLTRQILDAANKSNRKANSTQAINQQGLDSAFNEYTAGNESDLKKIDDQFGYDTGEADRAWGQNRQTALYKKADVYGAADKTAEREAIMNEGNGLNSFISNAAFMNPSYTGESKAMATPELGDYTQDIAKYDTAAIGAPGGLTPAGGASTTPGNLAIKAIAVNDKDLGIKKKIEGLDPVYGV